MSILSPFGGSAQICVVDYDGRTGQILALASYSVDTPTFLQAATPPSLT